MKDIKKGQLYKNKTFKFQAEVTQLSIVKSMVVVGYEYIEKTDLFEIRRYSESSQDFFLENFKPLKRPA